MNDRPTCCCCNDRYFKGGAAILALSLLIWFASEFSKAQARLRPNPNALIETHETAGDNPDLDASIDATEAQRGDGKHQRLAARTKVRTIREPPIPGWLYVVAGGAFVGIFWLANDSRRWFVRAFGQPSWQENRDLMFWVFVAAAPVAVFGWVAVFGLYLRFANWTDATQ